MAGKNPHAVGLGTLGGSVKGGEKSIKSAANAVKARAALALRREREK
jgi:hypothetical protein